MEIKRDKYIEKLVNRIGNGSIKIITGLRRSGKSYILNILFFKKLLEMGISEKNIIRFLKWGQNPKKVKKRQK